MPVDLLFVDDEVNILRALERLFFDRDEYRIHTATSGEEAMALLEEGLVPAVVMADQRMGGMSGAELLVELRRRHPDTVRMILTGYADLNTAIDAINRGAVFRYIMKPWEDDELVASVDEAVRHYQLEQENQRLTEELRQRNQELAELNARLEERVRQRTHELQRAYEKNLRLTMELEAKIRELEGWDTLHRHLLTIHSEAETLEVVSRVVCRVVCCEGVGIYFQGDDGLRAAYTEYEEELGDLPYHRELQAARARVLAERAGLLLAGDELPETLRSRLQSMVIVPVGWERRVIGVLEVATRHRELQHEEVAKLHALANQGAIALQDARMEEVLPELESSIDSVLQDLEQESGA